jgi:hypothetical protein
MSDRSFVIREQKGKELYDLSDLLNIARSIGKKAFNVERVNVKPEVTRIPDGYVVVICPEHNGHGCSQAHDVVSGKKQPQNAI